MWTAYPGHCLIILNWTQLKWNMKFTLYLKRIAPFVWRAPRSRLERDSYCECALSLPKSTKSRLFCVRMQEQPWKGDGMWSYTFYCSLPKNLSFGLTLTTFSRHPHLPFTLQWGGRPSVRQGEGTLLGGWMPRTVIILLGINRML